MASIGQTFCLYGPFSPSSQNILENTDMNCKIGISVDERDCMYYQNGQLVPDENQNFISNPIQVNISGKIIQIGRSFMYEPGDIINNASISFPNGAPASTKIYIIYS